MAARTATAGERAVGPRGSLWLPAAVIALLAAHYALAYTATLGASTTFDEPLHMVAGVAYWTLEDYRLQPENGILPQRWCALPLLAMGLQFPSLDNESWRQSAAALFGREYLYGLGNDSERMLAAARAVSGLWSTALCLVVFFWSRSIFGTSGGLVSLALSAFWPAFVAHGPLATSDACGALFFTLGGWSLWLLCQRVYWFTIVFAFCSVGLTVIAKHTNIVLGPLGIIFAALTAAVGAPLQIRLGRLRMFIGRRATRLAATLAAMVVPLAGAISVVCGWLERWRLLPEARIYGLSYVAATVRVRNAFALGQYSTDGWWWYFPLFFAIKNTLPSLVLTGWGVAATGVRIARGFRSGFKHDPIAFASLAPSAILVLLAVMFLTSAINIGERHLLPLYPPLIVLAGATLVGGAGDGSPRGQQLGSAFPRVAGVLVLLTLHATDVASRWPCSLAYFNQVVPRGREYRWLVDSNLDWGQDLRRLADFVGQHVRPAEPVFVDYFGMAEVQNVLPDATLIGMAQQPGTPQRLQPGLYCISATTLASVYDEPFGPWCQKFEDAYRVAAAFIGELPAATATDPRPDPAPILEVVADWRAELGLQKLPADTPPEHVATYAFNTLQAGRLRAFLRHREPAANVGGSFLVFRLSDADLSRALAGPPSELAARSWKESDSGGIAAARVREADAALDVGDLAGAERALAVALQHDPLNPKAWGRRGLLLAAQGSFAPAEAAFAKAARLDPRDPEPLYNLGNMLAARGQTAAAISAFDRALARNPAYRNALFNRGMLRLRANQPAAARVDLLEFRRLGGTVPAELTPLLDAESPPGPASPQGSRP